MVAVINAVLGIQPSAAADVNNDGAVNALDGVFVTNRGLGISLAQHFNGTVIPQKDYTLSRTLA